MKNSYVKVMNMLSILFLALSVVSCNNVNLESGTILWNYNVGNQLWTPLNYDRGNLYFGSDDMYFYSFNVTTKQIEWKFKTGGIIRSGSDITKEIVVFASDDRFLYTLDVNTGKELWKFDLGSSNITRRLPAIDPPYGYDYLHSSPIYHAGSIFIGSGDGKLYAIDHTTGKEQWHFNTSQKIRSTPVLDKDNIYFGSWDGNVYAVNIKSGEKVWQFDCGGIVQSSPAIGDGKIFIGSRSTKIFALDANTGEQIWQHVHTDGSWVESSPVYHDGVVYIGSSDALKLFAFDAITGKVMWEFKTDGWAWSTPYVMNGVVYIGGISAYPYYFEGIDLKAGFYAINQKSGKEIWSITPEVVEGYITGGVFSSGLIINGIVYVSGINGSIYGIKE